MPTISCDITCIRETLAAILVAIFACGATRAWAASPTISLSARDGSLAITGVSADTPPTLEVTCDDALPIVWHRGALREGTLPLVLLPGASDSITVTMLGESRRIVIKKNAAAQLTVEPDAYAKKPDLRPTSSPRDRRTTLLLAVAMATTVLLASLLRRGGAIAVTAVALTWTVGLALAAAGRATLIGRVEADGSRWCLALEPQTLHVPIRNDEAWVPSVDSVDHLRALAPRVVVEGKLATLELTLSRNAVVKLRRNSS